MIRTLGLAVMGVFLTFSNVSAGVITDTINQNQYVGWFGSHSYTHNINDDGFTPGSAVSGNLQIEIYDDRRDFFDWLPELILVVIEEFDFDSGGISFGAFSGDLEVSALAALNADGMLEVTVQSLLGDFRVGNSVLTVITEAVPEPGTLALLGLGLAGLGAARRRKA